MGMATALPVSLAAQFISDNQPRIRVSTNKKAGDKIILTLSMAENLTGEDPWIDLNDDGTKQENESIRTLDYAVEYVLGASSFTVYGNYRSLNAQGQGITTVDLTYAPALLYLNVNKNLISALNTSKNTNLTRLDCNENQLTSLDLSANRSLNVLSCSNNQIERITFPDNKGLAELYCESNLLTSLNLQGYTNLVYLYCDRNLLTEVNIAACENLTEFTAQGNQLQEANIADCPHLEYLQLEENQLKRIDISACEGLNLINCSINQMGYAQMMALVNMLPDRNGALNVGVIYVYNSQKGTEANQCSAAQAAVAKSKNWRVMMYDLTGKADFKGEEVPTVSVDVKTQGEGEALFLDQEYLSLDKMPVGSVLTLIPTPAQDWKVKEVTATGALLSEPDANGNYTLTLNENSIVTVTFEDHTGVNAPLSHSNLTVYPNPVSDVLNVSGAPAASPVHLWSTRGSLVLSTRCDEAGHATIQASQLPAGTYLLQVGSVTKRITVAQ